MIVKFGAPTLQFFQSLTAEEDAVKEAVPVQNSCRHEQLYMAFFIRKHVLIN